MTNDNFFKSIKYIYWRREATKINLTIEEAEAKLSFLQKNGKEALSKTKRLDWFENNTYLLEKHGYWRTLAVVENSKYFLYSWHSGDNKKNDGVIHHEGITAAKTINKRFQERTTKSLKGAFGYTEDDTLRSCVPKQFYYLNEFYKNDILSNISKVDFSSHYPDAMCGLLPDIRTAIKVDGEAEPNEEYRFAFYIGSGHCAEYNRFDTRKWKDHKIAKTLVFDRIGTLNDYCIPHYANKTEFTILCKASEFTLDEELRYFYSMKNSDPTAKLVMNAFIGYCHPKTNRSSYRLYHIAAICIGRANQKMIETAEKIGINNILQIIVDGIIYIDDNINCKTYSKNEKALGRLIKEISLADFKMIGTNQYMFMQNDEILNITASGFNAGVEETKSFEDMSNWRRV